MGISTCRIELYLLSRFSLSLSAYNRLVFFPIRKIIFEDVVQDDDGLY